MVTKAPYADCEHCPLQARPFVGGHGPTGPVEYAVVGIAPGEQEVKEGIPFIGPSGELLNKILGYNDIRREDVWATNAVLCETDPAVNNGVPPAAAIKACRDRLVRELRVHQPHTVLALGAVAAKTLLKDNSSISELRIEHDLRSEEIGARIVPTYHPAAALRSPNWFPSILKDVERATHAKVVWEYTRYKVCDSVERALDLFTRQQQQGKDGRIVCDIERDYERGTPNYPIASDPKFLCWAISHRPGASVVYTKRVVDHPLWRESVRRAFKNGVKWGWQNGKFDIQYLWAGGITNARVDADSMLLHYSTDERVGTHDLEQMAVESLNSPRYKTDARSYLPHKGASLRYLPHRILYEYNAADADITYRLFEKLEPESKSDETWNVYTAMMLPAANALAHVEYRGVGVDLPYLESLAARFSGELAERESALAQWVANPRSVPQVMAAIKELGYEVPNTRKDTIRDIPEEFTGSLLEYRSAQKLMSTYIKGLISRAVEGRIYTNFAQQTTETGRLSSSNPNLQNLPKAEDFAGFRDSIVASPGRVLLEADYQAIELRLLADFCNDPYMLQAFTEGRNFHKERAARIFGAGYNEQRYVHTKNVTYASTYMGSAGYVSHLYDIDLKAVKAVQADMFAKSPNIKRYWNETKTLMLNDSYLRSYFGRLRRFWLITRDNFKDLWKEGINFRISSVATDLTLRSLIKLEPMLRDVAPPIITVHDSLVFDCPVDLVMDVAKTVKGVMEDQPFRVPTPAEFKVGERWGSMRPLEVA